MAKSVYIDGRMYDHINTVSFNNEKELMMLIGGKTVGDKIVLAPASFKWFREDELAVHDDESVSIDEGVLIKNIMNISKAGYDSVFMIHSHPCKTKFDDYLYGSLSSQDMKNSKKLLLVSQFQNVNYYDGISTGQHIYFWSINNENLIPVQMNCYVDGKLNEDRVPGTIMELIDAIKGKK